MKVQPSTPGCISERAYRMRVQEENTNFNERLLNGYPTFL